MFDFSKNYVGPTLSFTQNIDLVCTVTDSYRPLRIVEVSSCCFPPLICCSTVAHKFVQHFSLVYFPCCTPTQTQPALNNPSTNPITSTLEQGHWCGYVALHSAACFVWRFSVKNIKSLAERPSASTNQTAAVQIWAAKSCNLNFFIISTYILHKDKT